VLNSAEKTGDNEEKYRKETNRAEEANQECLEIMNMIEKTSIESDLTFMQVIKSYFEDLQIKEDEKEGISLLL